MKKQKQNKQNSILNKECSIFICCILLCALMCVSLFTVCGCGCSAAGSGETSVHTFFVENSDGTYTYGELVLPAGYEKASCPLVVMSHGIYGTMNSGGAQELARRLADSGVAAVRVDFNRFTADYVESIADADGSGSVKAFVSDNSDVDLKDTSVRTNEYTISEMIESNLLAIGFAEEKYNIDSDRIGLYGRSFGGRLSMAMGNESSGGIDYKSMFLIAPAGNEYALIHYIGGEKKWNELRRAAEQASEADTVCQRNGLIFSPKWFEDYYRYIPSLTGDGFGDKPVVLYYNTKDTVVEPETSLDCARAYSNIEIHKVTSDNNHGYEMSFKDSALKEEIMNRVVELFVETL